MPHCLIEHSRALPAKPLVEKVFEGVLASALFEPDGSDIKVRAQGFDQFMVGRDCQDFVHVTLKILSGRTSAQKAALSHRVLEYLRTLDQHSCSLTVEVVDIDRESYAKAVT